MFMEKEGYTLVLRDQAGHDHNHHQHHNHDHMANPSHMREKVAVKLHYINSNPGVRLSGLEKFEYYHNYILGNKSENWVSRVPVFDGLQYRQLYPGIDLKYHADGDNLKYDIIVKAGANPGLIKWNYKGLDGLFLYEGILRMKAGEHILEESIPMAYQLIDGERKQVSCEYKIVDGIVSFEIGKYDHNKELIIDPLLIFSTYSGSTANNFGFTATYGNDGSLFSGGIVYGDGYPTTAGAILDTFSGGSIDMGISKFNDQGDQLLYSTYIGGTEPDVPLSMVVNSSNQLLILGNTGSSDFPITTNAYQDTFSGGPTVTLVNFLYQSGVDIVLMRLRSDGTALESSTFFGGTSQDGINQAIDFNYGDANRGEIIVDDNDNVYINSSTESTDISGTTNTPWLAQNAIVASFNSSLSQLRWATYFGGDDGDCGFSVKIDPSGNIFTAGATRSTNLPGSSTTHGPSANGLMDGYIAKFNGSTGSHIATAYIGTAARDELYFIDIDRSGDVYSLGQSNGNIPISSGVYSKAGSYQFMQKYSNDLTSVLWSTQIGSGQGKYDLVPTAFMVDRCFNIYLSGWNGASNTATGNTNGLDTTADAFQTTTDGSDFYFMVLSRNAQNLMYGSYFGGTSPEHVDGGTSRFSPNGIIYQAVCAGCRNGTFPTTPASYSPTKGAPPSQCNLGVIKMDFEQTVRAIGDIDFQADVDTVCDQLNVTFTNNSINGDKFSWDFGNGDTSDLAEPTVTYQDTGTYTVTLIASDTICGLSDTTEITIVHDQGELPTADFSVDHTSCDSLFEASFINNSHRTHTYVWDFGDGDVGTDEEPVHFYTDWGTYDIQLIAFDTICNKSDTIMQSITFTDTVIPPTANISFDECSNGLINIELINQRTWYDYTWNYDDQTVNSSDPTIIFIEPGEHTIQMIVRDTICNRRHTEDFTVNLENLVREIFVPNAFTPNEDNLNEEFKIFGKSCSDLDFFMIFNRWGAKVFETDQPFDKFWDATFQGKEAPQGVYTYRLQSGDKLLKGSFMLIR